MIKDFKLPDLGEGVHEGQIVRVHVKPGDIVREDQPLMEVETDKAAVEIPCPFAGTVEKVHVKAGQLAHVGDVMVTINDSKLDTGSRRAGQGTGGATSVGPRGANEVRVMKPSVADTTAVLAKPQAATTHRTRHTPASPAVRKLARTMGVDIETIRGSGPGGRVQRADVEMAATVSPSLKGGGQGVGEARDLRGGRGSPHTISSTPVAGRATLRERTPNDITRPTHPLTPSLPGRGESRDPIRAVAARVAHAPLPESLIVEPSAGEGASDAFGLIKTAPLTQARKTIAKVMTQSWTTIPHATDCDDADVTELDKLRRGYTPPPPEPSDRKINMLAFVVRAVVRALQRFPDFNAQFDQDKEQIIYHRYFTIGIAVHTERGLIVPVLRDADRLTIPAINDELAVIAEKARTATFAVNDMRGATYTISNAGAMGGSRYSTPIITPGQAAVLAIGKTRWMPWVIEQENGVRGLAPRLIMPLSQSIDHRLLDGGNEIAFMQHVIGDLQNPARLLL